MYSSGPSSNVSAAVPGTVQVVITCASGVARVSSWLKSGVGFAETSKTDESRPTRAKILDNIIGWMKEQEVLLLQKSEPKSAVLYTRGEGSGAEVRQRADDFDV